MIIWAKSSDLPFSAYQMEQAFTLERTDLEAEVSSEHLPGSTGALHTCHPLESHSHQDPAKAPYGEWSPNQGAPDKAGLLPDVPTV